MIKVLKKKSFDTRAVFAVARAEDIKDRVSKPHNDDISKFVFQGFTAENNLLCFKEIYPPELTREGFEPTLLFPDDIWLCINMNKWYNTNLVRAYTSYESFQDMCRSHHLERTSMFVQGLPVYEQNLYSSCGYAAYYSPAFKNDYTMIDVREFLDKYRGKDICEIGIPHHYKGTCDFFIIDKHRGTHCILPSKESVYIVVDGDGYWERNENRTVRVYTAGDEFDEHYVHYRPKFLIDKEVL
jgi:hypothetical protein